MIYTLGLHSLAAALLAVCGAQEPAAPASTLSGTVFRSDRSVWSDAEVVLYSHPWRLPIMDEAFVHRAGAVPGPDGAFESEVAVGYSYSAWAVSAVEEGRYTISNLLSGVSAGQSLSLTEGKTQRIVAVEVVSLDAWEGEGPFSFEVSCVINDHYFVDCELNDAGHALIPPMPDAALFRVRSASGVVIAGGMVPLNESARRKAAAKFKPRSITLEEAPHSIQTVSEELARVVVQPPVGLHLEVLGLRKPLKGARVFWMDGADRRLVAKTDKKGRAEVRVPSHWGSGGAPSLAHASLWVEAPGWSSANWFNSNVAVKTEGGRPEIHTISLPKGNSIEGRLLLSRGRPAANAPILVHTGFPSGTDLTGLRATNDGAARVVWTDKKGNFEVQGLAPHIGWQVSTILGADADVGISPEYPVSPLVVIGSGEDASKKTFKLGTITLSKYRAIDVTVAADDGEGGVVGDVTFLEELMTSMQEPTVCTVRSGPDGRIRILGRPKSRLLMTARGSTERKEGPMQTVDVGSGARPVTLTLSASRD